MEMREAGFFPNIRVLSFVAISRTMLENRLIMIFPIEPEPEHALES